LLDDGDAGKAARPIAGTTAPAGNAATVRAALTVSRCRNDIGHCIGMVRQLMTAVYQKRPSCRKDV
jgi:hypothetical protein